MIEKLQYITQENESISHIQCVAEACISGVKWIQLRVKNKSEEDYLEIAEEAKIICDLYDVRLIINDNVEITKQVNAYGVHLGKSDMSPLEARKILGKEVVIGGTANTMEDIQNLIQLKVDYIGLGPYQFTNTKEDLSKVLGLEGYEKIMNELKLKCSMEEIPIVAVGGIGLEDIQPLVSIGLYGVAASGLITNERNKEGLVKEINGELRSYPNSKEIEDENSRQNI